MRSMNKTVSWINRMAALLSLSVISTQSHATPLPDAAGQSADMTKPVQVFICMGQSNMLGFGKVNGGVEGRLDYAVLNKGLYPYMVNDQGSWTERQDVRYTRIMGSGLGAARLYNNEWLNVAGDRNIGPEHGIGHQLGHAIDAPVLLLKSCIGNRSLGWDLLPPDSPQYEFRDNGKDYIYAGYGESPLRWEKGTTPVPIGWSAGLQYKGDVRSAKDVLAQIERYYPGAAEYEIAGFFWWQGDKDRYNAGHAARYEENMVQLIEQLRVEFDAPDAKFVAATLGQTQIGAGGSGGMILDAQLAVDGEAGNYPQFAGNVATVYTNPLSRGGASSNHYNGNAETYMNVGEAMGQAMVELILSAPEPPVILSAQADPATLWPPNRKMVEVQVSAVVDGGTGELELEIVKIECDEPHSASDYQILNGHTVALRAARGGKGSGRTYTLYLRVTDEAGLESEVATATVFVPHDQGNRPRESRKSE